MRRAYAAALHPASRPEATVTATHPSGPLGALLAVPMSLFFKAILVEMDPDASWVTPLVSGRPEGGLF